MKIAQAALIAAVLLGFAPTASAADGSAQCSALQSSDFGHLDDAPTQITEARLTEAKGDVPAYCGVHGYVAPQVGFEIRLPVSTWNGKFMHLGCGGMCGQIWTWNCAMPLRKGYACIASDMGHKGLSTEAMWAYNNLQ